MCCDVDDVCLERVLAQSSAYIGNSGIRRIDVAGICLERVLVKSSISILICHGVYMDQRPKHMQNRCLN